MADYYSYIQASVIVCIMGYLALLWILRRDGASLGLPFAYLSLLLVNHVPGAFVQLVDDQFYPHASEVEIGIRFTAIGTVFFVLGVWLARARDIDARKYVTIPTPLMTFEEDHSYWIFCLVGGLVATFGLASLRYLPSIGALVVNGGAIWMLGAVLGLRWSVREGNLLGILMWLAALSVYPAMIFITAGFLSYGTTAVLVGVCALAISARRVLPVLVVIVVVSYLGLSLFSNYFQARDNIRAVIWSGATTAESVAAISQIATDFKLFDTSDELALTGLDIRLNQNYFVGLAAENIENGSVEYVYGRSVSDAILALVPRALWPNKTVYGGSPKVVGEFTGLNLDLDTSFGIGNVMEFYVNFGIPGVIAGFLGLGWLLGRFDQRAALAVTRRDYASATIYFLPAVGLIQPIGSMVEMAGSAGSAWIAAFLWNFLWARWQDRAAESKRLAGLASDSGLT